MILFIILALTLTILALLFVLLPLLGYHDQVITAHDNQANLAIFHQQLAELDMDLASGLLEQPQYLAAKRDLQRNLAHDITPAEILRLHSERWVAPTLAAIVPLFTIVVYATVGDFSALTRASFSNREEHTNTAENSSSPGRPQAQSEMIALVERLAERMRANPYDLQGWLMLGRSARVLGQDQRAVAAYAQALRLAPTDPEVMLAYADAMAQEAQSFAGKPSELLTMVLAKIPNNPQALWLAGLAALQAGNNTKAIMLWNQLLPMLPTDSPEAATLRRLLLEAQ